MNWESKAEMIAGRLQEAELFSKRFGSFAKTDYETLMFSIYLEMLDKPARDYDISLELGITETKVRNLRVKAQLVYPKPLLCKTELAEAIKKGFFDPDNCTLTIMIEDPSTQSYIKNQIEKQQGIVLLGYNPKHLTLPIESYILIAASLEENETTAIQKLNEKWLAQDEKASEIKKEDLVAQYWTKNKGLGLLKLMLDCAAEVWPVAAPVVRIIKSKIN